ncbi:MAG: hypothetical protein AVDCRST_MAG77-4023 [uncultured Chloroflexi bacterium]|uniref:SCP domain-containing protein n=1 Tax=uncultured Chloroflexota bacterium TaxID=166587 RepID=A0A6J4JNL7_9CHLR|nr:MAG: hypothetical protein AVDCRST_MAG77-4023 [uncultured Chloroflexota bacterium]
MAPSCSGGRLVLQAARAVIATFRLLVAAVVGTALACLLLSASVGSLLPVTVHADLLMAPSQVVAGTELQFLDALNADRVANGLTPLNHDAELGAVARWRSEDMVARAYFSHDIGGYMVFQVLKDRGITYQVAGENLAHLYGTKNAAVRAEMALMRSPTHRANVLLVEYTHVGVGVALGPNGSYVFTQLFKRSAL